MKQKNKYAKRARLSEVQLRQFLRCFAADLNACQIAQLTSLNRNTVNRYLRALRERIATLCAQHAPVQGEVEVDESYFGPRRVKGKRGRGASGKTIVFGLIQRQGRVYTEIVPDCRKATLQAVIRGQIDLDSVIYSDGWRGYDGLVDVGYGKHLRVEHRRDEFARGPVHVNGIESFWGYAKTRLVRFRGLPKHTFHLHLKECEFRFNHRTDNLYSLLLKFLRKQPLC